MSNDWNNFRPVSRLKRAFWVGIGILILLWVFAGYEVIGYVAHR
jgi:hypothetical protein